MMLAAGVSLSACGGAAEAAGDARTPQLSRSAPGEPAVGGYEGWWNATPASGGNAGLPQETVAINTRTNLVVDAFSRTINGAGRPTLITDVPYSVVPDPSWPADSVVIIDTATNRVIEHFRVDLKGEPLR
ncbi:hypothetical protein VUN84_05775 [Micrococcaceae bacterium Sec5.8]